jgi:hypothetical protein
MRISYFKIVQNTIPSANDQGYSSSYNGDKLSPRLVGPPTSTLNNASRKLKQCFNANYKNFPFTLKQTLPQNDGKEKKVIFISSSVDFSVCLLYLV